MNLIEKLIANLPYIVPTTKKVEEIYIDLCFFFSYKEIYLYYMFHREIQSLFFKEKNIYIDDVIKS